METEDHRPWRRRRRRLSHRQAGGAECSPEGETRVQVQRQQSWPRPSSIDDFTDDLLELILLHISYRVGLVRSAATCQRWRRLIADDGFLSRFRSLHGTEAIGHYYVTNHSAVFVPTPRAPGKTAINVTVSYRNLYPCSLASSVLTDSRGGLLALVCHSSGCITVCNPWIRQHKKFYPPFRGSGKSSFVDCLSGKSSYVDCLGTFLLDGDGDETGAMSHFKVLCVRLFQPCHDNSKKTVQADVYSARDGRWLSLSTTAVGDIADIAPKAGVPCTKPFVFLGRACGSLCWSAKRGNGVFHLNESTGEFSSVTLPRPAAGVNENSLVYNRSNLRVVGGDAGRDMRLVHIDGNDLEVLRHARSGVACVVERRVCLPQLLASINGRPDMSWCFMDTAEAAAPDRVVISQDANWMFIVDVGSMKLVSTQKRSGSPPQWVLPYELPWPPIIKVCM